MNLKYCFSLVSGCLVLAFVSSGCCCSHPAKAAPKSVTMTATPESILATGSWKSTPADVASPEVLALLQKIDAAAAAAQTMTADFSYTVSSLNQQQLITGKVRMMKPNFMRITYDYMAHPAFPNPVAADGQKLYTFKPRSFQPNRTFSDEPFDPILGARQASGLAPGGGTYSDSVLAPDGSNIHLWDSIVLQAFFKPTAGLQYLYYNKPGQLKSEGKQEINGIVYDVIQHHVGYGNIAGGANSSFEQHIYVNPDGFITMYLLEFTAKDRPGIQIMRFTNVQTNVPMTATEFSFTPPVAGEAAK